MSDNSVKILKPIDITSDMLVVDLRPQIDYDRAHFDGAISLCFPQILFRRLIRRKNEPKALDDFLLGDTQILRERHSGKFIVMYDDSTIDINMCKPSDPFRIFGDIFLAENTNFAFVEGGFQALKNAFPHMIIATAFSPFSAPINNSPKSSPIEIDPYTMPLSFFLENFMAIGSETHAQDITLLNTLKITHILNVTPNETLEEVKIGREILQIPIFDSISQNILEYLPRAIKFIHTARTTPNAKLLIHCHAGISRSVSFAIAYVMWAERKSFEDAIAIIHKHRPCASPNLNFMGQLMIFGNFMNLKTEEISSPTYIVSQAIEYIDVLNNKVDVSLN